MGDGTVSLQSSWKRAWLGLGAEGDGLAVMRKLLEAYAEPQRRYHTLQHLAECLALFEGHRDLAAQQAEVEIALWFHDAVYDLERERGDNEARSAKWAEAELRAAGVAAGPIARVAGLILASRHAALPQSQDQKLLVDIDLAILGAPRPRFEEYEAQIRAEYGGVPDALFRRKRREVLSGFLARSPLYTTPRLRELFEVRAKENLADSLKRS